MNMGVQCNIKYIMHFQNSFCSHRESFYIGVAKLQTLVGSYITNGLSIFDVVSNSLDNEVV